jgi:hypothetical protein
MYAGVDIGMSRANFAKCNPPVYAGFAMDNSTRETVLGHSFYG